MWFLFAPQKHLIDCSDGFQASNEFFFVVSGSRKSGLNCNGIFSTLSGGLQDEKKVMMLTNNELK